MSGCTLLPFTELKRKKRKIDGVSLFIKIFLISIGKHVANRTYNSDFTDYNRDIMIDHATTMTDEFKKTTSKKVIALH